MGIESFIARLCTQTAVYWGSPVDDGYGGKTFADPVEISCRWEVSTEVLMDDAGVEFSSRARVFLTQDVEKEGWLYLGDLDDLDSNPDDPKDVEGAYEIRRFDKKPNISGVEFLRIAYL